MTPKSPFLTVDVIIEYGNGITMIKRKNPPFGWALPGGFVEYGETLEQSALREAKEETGLDIRLIRQFHTYSAPDRDPRHHTVSTVFIAKAQGMLKPGDDAKDADVFKEDTLPHDIAFDHREILKDYFSRRF